MGAVSRSTGRDSSTIQVIAHRGSSEDAPEHTLSAYKRALDDGADALECDVRLTRDGHLVCVHDRRVDRTSNGRGVLSTLELAELSALDFGSWRDTWEDFEDPEVPDRDRAEILTLRRLLETVAHARPAGRARDRDQAPHALRRPGRAAAGRPAGALRVGAPAARPDLAGAGDELLAAVAAPDARAGAERADRLPDGAGAAAVPRRHAASRGAHRRAQHRGGAGAPPLRRAGAAPRPRGARLDRGRRRGCRAVPRPRRGRHHHQPAAAGPGHARPDRRCE